MGGILSVYFTQPVEMLVLQILWNTLNFNTDIEDRGDNQAWIIFNYIDWHWNKRHLYQKLESRIAQIRLRLLLRLCHDSNK